MSRRKSKSEGDASAANLPISPSVITPQKLIRLYESDEWEQFILEWGDGFEPKYDHIDRLGGAGDKGRDIVGYAGPDKTSCPIDVYQCKHYNRPLQPNDIWSELGKLCVFTHRGDYRTPRSYKFVAPRGVGTSLATLLEKPEKLKEQLINVWGDKCETRISSLESFPLKDLLLSHVENFNFAIVGYLPVLKILEQHHRTPYWHQRFKRDYPNRPTPDPAPDTVQQHELRYVEQLLEAYSDFLKSPVPNVGSISTDRLQQHFVRARTAFYMADSLNRFYRDQFPPGAFNHVKDQVYDGVIEIGHGSHLDGLSRIDAVIKQAVVIQLANTDYAPYVEAGDKKGVCHHLANDDKLKWVPT